jgi:hypothetical protein
VHASSIRQLLSVEFERFRFLGKYLAICSYEAGTIEAAIRSMPPGGLRRLAQHTSRESIDLEDEEEGTTNLAVSHSSGPVRLLISPPTDAFTCLGGSSYITRHGTFKIEGLRITQHDQAVSLLERLANSFFFQIDLSTDIAVRLFPDRRAQPRIMRRRGIMKPSDLEFPRNEYDEASMALYWYGRGAIGMPLLQYLAFYQSIEFYFPTYSQAEARRRIRGIIKNPAFRMDRDADIGKILSLMQGGGQGFGNERDQLRATIQECLDPALLREFLTQDDECAKFFSKKIEGLTDKKLPIGNVDADLRNDVADRIYDIRCKIVHTKGGPGDTEVDLLLPFSPQAELLSRDIELIQFVAREVLVAASSPLQL